MVGTLDSRTRASHRALDWFSFFMADVQTGFGPFMAVYLTSEKWPNADIGMLLTVGSLVGLAGQIPAGALIDATKRERLIIVLSVTGIGASALLIALAPQFLFTLFAQVLHVTGSVFIGPALAALSLKLVGRHHLGGRLGRNAQWASAGTIFAVIVMGACGYYFSSRAVFFTTAAMALPAVVAILFISPRALAHGNARTARNESYSIIAALSAIRADRRLLILGIVVFFFHLSNAGVMPLAASVITMRSQQSATLLVALCIILPQLVVTSISRWVGEQADTHGRKPFLLCAFATIAIRSLLFAFFPEPLTLVGLQILDGISGAIIGVLIAVCVADLTRKTDNFNLTLGLVGGAMGLGAAASTALIGDLADSLGVSTAFLVMSFFSVAGFGTLWRYMPETAPSTRGEDE